MDVHPRSHRARGGGSFRGCDGQSTPMSNVDKAPRLVCVCMCFRVFYVLMYSIIFSLGNDELL